MEAKESTLFKFVTHRTNHGLTSQDQSSYVILLETCINKKSTECLFYVDLKC